MTASGYILPPLEYDACSAVVDDFLAPGGYARCGNPAGNGGGFCSRHIAWLIEFAERRRREHVAREREADKVVAENVVRWLHDDPGPVAVGTYLVLNADTKLLKIGRSQNIAKRLQELRLMSGARLVLLSYIPDEAAEGRLHSRFHRFRVFGEWFRIGPELRDFLDETVGLDRIIRAANALEVPHAELFSVEVEAA